MSRFFEADAETLNLLDEVVKERFSSLVNANIKVVMDGKEKINKSTGMAEFAYIKKASEMENFLVDDEDEIAYFIFIHALVWELASPDNKKRLISHELRHTFVDEKGRYKIVPHEVTDFYAEIELNIDDPKWGQDLGDMVRFTYEQRKDDGTL